MCQKKLKVAITITAALFASAHDATMASTSVRRPVFPDICATSAWRSSAVIYMAGAELL